MKNRWRSSLIAILALAICVSAAYSQDRRNAVRDLETTFPELPQLGQPEWSLVYTDGIGGLREVTRHGIDREVFRLPNQFLDVGYSALLERYVLFEHEDLGHKIGADGKLDEFPSYRTVMHHVDKHGTIKKTIPLPSFQRTLEEVSFSPSGRFVLVATNRTERIVQRRTATDYDAFRVNDIYEINLETGATEQLLRAGCRSLGEIHPQEDRVLFTDEDGFICEFDLMENSVTPLVEGSRAYWNSDGSAVRYILTLNWVSLNGDTYSSRQSGDDEYEFEYNIKTKKKAKLGLAGDDFCWSPDRKYGVRTFFYDTLFPPRIGLGKVVLESSDRERQALLIKDIRYPASMFWMKRGERDASGGGD